MLDKQSKETRIQTNFIEYIKPGNLSFKERAAKKRQEMYE
jgi:hypothetical protein